MSWVLLAVLSAMLIGGYEVSRKSAVEQGSTLVVLLVATVSGLVCLLPLVFLSRFAPTLVRPLGLEVLSVGAEGHLRIFFKAILVSVSWSLTYAAVRHLPLSLASPIRATAPVFTVLGALLLFGEAPATGQWIGMALVFCGYFGFLSIGRREGIVFETNRWVWLLLAGTVFGASSGLYDKYLLQEVRIDPTTLQFWFTFYGVFVQGGLVLSIWWPRRRKEPFVFSWAAPLTGALLVLADQLYLRAMADPGALVSVVSLTRRSSVIVSFVVGGLWFRERFLRQKAVVLGVVLTGLGVLVVSSSAL